MRRAASMPSRRGILTSRMARSGRSLAASSTASSPSRASAQTLKPARSRISRRSSRMIVSSSAIRIRTPGRRVEGRAYPSMSCGSSQLGRRHGPRDGCRSSRRLLHPPNGGCPPRSGEEEVVDQEPDERPREAGKEQAEEQSAEERDGLPRLGGLLLVPRMILSRPGVVGLRRALVDRARFLGETLLLLSVPASLHPSVPQRDGRYRPEP